MACGAPPRVHCVPSMTRAETVGGRPSPRQPKYRHRIPSPTRRLRSRTDSVIPSSRRPLRYPSSPLPLVRFTGLRWLAAPATRRHLATADLRLAVPHGPCRPDGLTMLKYQITSSKRPTSLAVLDSPVTMPLVSAYEVFKSPSILAHGRLNPSRRCPARDKGGRRPESPPGRRIRLTLNRATPATSQ
ncbi:hypothetical protein BS50DRAFT_302052 [Corynespora cassiicola Philippines]|uniref:Uncharacterized protein n=1 Tax=Corynespora cassiicola Philippines TaxID=1448308 RepID=A0A2T2NX44_CORCC|nr:hypothetical protein BS50DRAFT_302052 [Corynespora cassiicola Philippines]